MTANELINKMASRPNYDDLSQINWNVSEIKKRIRAISFEIYVLKREMRESGHNVTWSEQCELGALKHRATVLSTLQAFRRNKLHRQNSCLAEQADWLDSHLDLTDREEMAKTESAS